jgi:alanyl-tRNA synthetase
MQAQAIRQAFLDFFQTKGHRIVASAPIVVQNDPTLMFTNAGMNPFKDIFLGNRQAEAPRVADTQKCLRVSGKHNDLEEVGVDTYHHTMFEMLGNWSFGDYFKEEAIDWAFAFLTETLGIDKAHMYATVFEGDAEDSLEADAEAESLWARHLPAERILRCNKKDNFWEMGDTGPCGPCSEIHVDLRPEGERQKTPGRELVNADHPQVIEIWNLVFIQFNRAKDGTLSPLPERHVDTGMGFERLAMVLQGKGSSYDTDIFQPLIQAVSSWCGKSYGQDLKTDIAFRVIVDHIRAVAFTIADGQLPSNNGAGYVVRRILRRAVRYGYSYLGFEEPFFHKLVPHLTAQMGEAFPELGQQETLITRVIKEEEVSFLRTLASGLKRLEHWAEGADAKTTLDGATAFELYDTYGFPIDLTRLVAAEQGFGVDEAGFDKEMAAQKARSKKAAETDTGEWQVLEAAEANSAFLGYDQLQSPARALMHRTVEQKKKKVYQVVYAESGGQIGDTGVLDWNGEAVTVLDTKKENDLIVHWVDRLPANPSEGAEAIKPFGHPPAARRLAGSAGGSRAAKRLLCGTGSPAL